MFVHSTYADTVTVPHGNLQQTDRQQSAVYLLGLRSGKGLEYAAGEGIGDASMDFKPGLEEEDCALGSAVSACLLGLLSRLALRLQVTCSPQACRHAQQARYSQRCTMFEMCILGLSVRACLLGMPFRLAFPCQKFVSRKIYVSRAASLYSIKGSSKMI